jgi:ElaB/YqjD/DUF883 family membrane-anchored ribosome-binding protein
MSTPESINVIPDKLIGQVSALSSHATRAAEDSVKSAQRFSEDAVENLTRAMENIHHQTAPWLKQAGGDLNSMVQRGMASAQETTKLVQEHTLKTKQSAEHYISTEPVKALLIAAASGAALMALISLASRSK